VTDPGTVTRAGYTLDGWYTAASGGTAWAFASDTVTADTTLYAHWTAITYTNSAALTLSVSPLTDTGSGALTVTGPLTADTTVTVEAGYTGWEWYVDGVQKGTTGSFTLTVANYYSGSHELTVIVYKDNKPWSARLTFTVL
jgi:uncharacterized repeat protein (TIGR02543 family)